MTPEPENNLIAGLVAALRKRWRILVALTLAGGAAGGLAASTAESLYHASASIRVRDPAIHIAQLHAPPGRSLVPLTDDLRVPHDPTHLERAGKRLGLSSTDLAKKVEYSAPPSPMAAISVVGEDEEPGRAAEIANVVAQETIRRRLELDFDEVGIVIQRTEEDLASLPRDQRQSGPGRLMRQAVTRLTAYQSATARNAELVGRAEAPTEADTDARPSRSAAAGALAGLLVAAGLALALERPRRRPEASSERE